MRTPDMSDEELDRLFRTGAEAYPDEVSLAGWLRLSTQLDEQEYQRQLRQQVWRRVAAVVLLLLSIAGTAMWWWQRPSASEQQLTRTSSTNQASATEKPEAAPAAQADTRPAAPNKRRLAVAEAAQPTGSPATQPAGPGRKAAAARQEANRASGTSARKPRPALAGNAGTATAASTQQTSANQTARSSTPKPNAGTVSTSPAPAAVATTVAPVPPPSTPPAAPSAAAAASSPTTAAATASSATVPAASRAATAPPATAATVAADSVPRSSQPSDSTATPLPRPDSVQQAPPAPPVAVRYRLGVALVGGPEAAQILGGPTARVGGTVGVLLDYQVLPRWRVRTGVLRSVKRYGARAEDYSPPAGYWTWYVPIDQVDANCRITEIPLEVRYDVLIRPRQTLYATAGVTSVLMRNERYTYFYQQNGRPVVRDWTLARGSESAARIARLSVGLEQRLAGRWSMQAEPFLNLPLGGIGFGQVRFQSAGLLLGLRYGLLAPRREAAVPIP